MQKRTSLWQQEDRQGARWRSEESGFRAFDQGRYPSTGGKTGSGVAVANCGTAIEWLGNLLKKIMSGEGLKGRSRSSLEREKKR